MSVQTSGTQNSTNTSIFSDYPRDHPNYNPTNAKVLSKFKCETNCKPIGEWVGLKAKMYGIKVAGKERLTAKGCPKNTMKKHTSFDIFKRTLQRDEVVPITFNAIKRKNHQVVTMNNTKVGLTNFENKRYYLNNVDSLAYGHKDIPK
jgi:hypothetical protein